MSIHEAISSRSNPMDEMALMTGGCEELIKQYRDKLQLIKDKHLIPVGTDIMYSKFYSEVRDYVTNLKEADTF